ncbi:SpaA isopeptide-forming pilin-related protein [Enterococcus rotai]|nr:SpaA isopeptide-forming pilin-related protein [Enterococcus rotai]
MMKRQKFWIVMVLLLMIANSLIPVVSFAETFLSENTSEISTSTSTSEALNTVISSESSESAVINETSTEDTVAKQIEESVVASTEVPEKSAETSTSEVKLESRQAKAQQTENLITNVTLTDPKGVEYDTTTNRPQRQAPLKLSLQVGTENQTIQAGTYEYQLPADIAISNNISGRLETVGSWTLDTTGKLTIIFNETVVNGKYQIDIETSFIPYSDDSDLLKTITFSLANNQEKKYELLFKLSGEGSINLKKNKNFNTDIVSTEIKTNINRQTIQPNETIVVKSKINKNGATGTENASAYVTVKNVKVFAQDVSMGGSLIGEPTLLGSEEYTLQQNNTDLTVTLKKETNKAIIMTYDSVIKEESIVNEELYNLSTEATIYGTSLSNYVYFQYNHNPHMTKKGEYNVKTNTIVWTIDYNLDSTELALGTKLTDILTDEVPNDLTFSNLKIYNLYVYGTGSISLGGLAPSNHWDTSGFGQYTTDYIYTNNQSPTSTAAYRFVYETAIQNPSPREIENKVSDSLGSDDAKVNLAPSNISKILEEDSLDMTSGTVDWSIIVNNKHWGMQFSQMIDQFGERVNELVDGSEDFYYYAKGDDKTKHPLVAGQDYTISKTSSGFTVNMLGIHQGITTNKYVLTYTSKFDNTDIKVGDELSNKVSLTGNGNIPMEASATFNIPSFLVEGGKKNVSYNSNEGVLTWTIGINEERHKYKNLILNDDIESIQKLDKNSIEIVELDKIVNDNGNVTVMTGAKIQPGDDRYPTVMEIKDNQIHLEFSTIGNKKVAVRYKTAPSTAPVSDYYTKFSNIAKVSDEGSYTHELKAELTVPLGINTYKIGRVSTVDNKLANWTIRTNIMPANRPYKQLVLEDTFTLSDLSKAENTNFVIGTDAFVVRDQLTNNILRLGEDYDITFTYDQDQSPAGSAIKSYDTNYFKITFKKETRGVTVEYQTVTTKSANIRNTAVFTNDKAIKADWATVNHTVTSGSGSGKGVGQIPLKKVDAQTQQPLSGAVFELFDKESQQSLGLKITSDQDGNAAFQSVAEGEYLVKEITAPDGYKLSEDYEKGVLLSTKSDDDINDPNYVTTIENERIITTGDIELKKVDTDGQALSGAEFILSHSEQGQTTFYQENEQGQPNWTANQNEAKVFTSNDEGLILVSGMSAGTYSFIETKAPAGYQLDSTPVSLELTKEKIESKTKVTERKENQLLLGSLRVNKIDLETKQALSGAEFTLVSQADPDKKITKTTNKAGIAEFKDLPQATYTLIETKAPVGYLLKEIGEIIEINPEHLNRETTIENAPIAGEIKFHHIDTNGKEIADDDIIKGKVGTTQKVQPKEIKGYRFKEKQQSASRLRVNLDQFLSTDDVMFTEAPQTIVYVYEQVSVPPIVDPTIPKETDVTKIKSKTTKTTSLAKKKLPRTNEQTEYWYSVLGNSVLVSLLGYCVIYYYRKKQLD